jgi:hypothetical protein
VEGRALHAQRLPPLVIAGKSGEGRVHAFGGGSPRDLMVPVFVSAGVNGRSRSDLPTKRFLPGRPPPRSMICRMRRRHLGPRRRAMSNADTLRRIFSLMDERDFASIRELLAPEFRPSSGVIRRWASRNGQAWAR